MSKVAQYLNEHLLGEVTTNEGIRRKYSTDGSILAILPDMIAYPRTTSDLRKIARFCWQLGEKGHPFSMTPRGGGTGRSGGAIGDGIIIDVSVHMNTIFELDAKQRLVRLQPGVKISALREALRLNNLYIPSLEGQHEDMTIGGAVAVNASGRLSGKHGAILDALYQIEVVLANGEVLQTGRISKRDCEKKKGLQTLEGELYRGIDTILMDNNELISGLATDVRDNAGYSIESVQNRDHSIDLLPLFVGSEGTLGIISEIILQAEPIVDTPLIAAFAFHGYDTALDSLDTLRELKPSSLEIIDSRYFELASANGKRYQFYADALDWGDVSAIVIAEFDDHGNHAKKKIAKKISKLFEDDSSFVALERDLDKVDTLRMLLQAYSVAQVSEKSDLYAPPLFEGAYVPAERLEKFVVSLGELESKYGVDLPLYGHASQHVYSSYPLFNFTKVSERQKAVKLLADWSAAVSSHGGHLIGEYGEGRIKSSFSYADIGDELVGLYTSVKSLFDPLAVMNSGVKQQSDMKKLAGLISSDFIGDDSAFYMS